MMLQVKTRCVTEDAAPSIFKIIIWVILKLFTNLLKEPIPSLKKIEIRPENKDW